MTDQQDKLIFAVPKGRILDDCLPLFKQAGIHPEKEFFNSHSRQYYFKTNHPNLFIIRVRSFDVATFVAFGAAQFGIVGSDVLSEFKYNDLYSPLDLNIGHCRLSVAGPENSPENSDPSEWSHIRIATKYPETTKRHFAAKGIQAECIKLNGAIELAPHLGLCQCIVDLVSTGNTLKVNNLKEIETILDVSARLIVNRTAFKTRINEIQEWMSHFKEATSAVISEKTA